MNRTAKHTGPLSVAELQTAVHLSASGAGPARRVPAADAYQVDTLPTALVLKDGIEPADACICDAICKVVISEHTLNIQVLDADRTHLAVVRQLMSDLVNVIKSLIGDLDMYACDMMLNLLPAGRTLRLVTQFPLVMLQTLFSRLGKMSSLEFTTIGAYGKSFYTGINTDSGSFFHSGTRFLADGGVHEDGSIVLTIWVHRDSHILNLAAETPVKNDRNVFTLRDAKSFMFPINCAVLRIMERLPILLALKHWMISSMLPPVFESICHLLDSILQRLRVDLAKPRVYLLQCDKLSLGSIVANAYTTSAPHYGHIV